MNLKSRRLGRSIQKITTAVAVASGVLVSQSALSQSMLEEVVVTAQKREQSLQDVGIAVSAFTGDQLRAFNATTSFDIAAYTPGVHISGNLAGQNTQYTIRGVTPDGGNDQPIQGYIDEVPLRAQDVFSQMYDTERVEILKGSQGTLQGVVSTAGAIQIYTRSAEP